MSAEYIQDSVMTADPRSHTPDSSTPTAEDAMLNMSNSIEAFRELLAGELTIPQTPAVRSSGNKAVWAIRVFEKESCLEGRLSLRAIRLANREALDILNSATIRGVSISPSVLLEAIDKYRKLVEDEISGSG